MSFDTKPTAVDAKLLDDTLDTKNVILQLTTCLEEETKRATTSKNITALEPLYNDVLLRMKDLRGRHHHAAPTPAPPRFDPQTFPHNTSPAPPRFDLQFDQKQEKRRRRKKREIRDLWIDQSED